MISLVRRFSLPMLAMPSVGFLILSGIETGAQSARVKQPVKSAQSVSTAVQHASLDSEYQKHFAYYNAKINQGLAKGWLSASEAANFQTKLAWIRKMELNNSRRAFEAKHSYYLNRKITRFQNELVAAEQKKPAPKSE